MPYKIIYLDEARKDIKEAKRWYKQQREGLQKQFATAIIQAIARLQDHPDAFAVRYKNIRIVHTKRFPFCIHFYVDKEGNYIVITAIIHEYRDVEILDERE